MDGRGVFEQVGDDVEEQAQSATGLGHHGLDCSHRHRHRQDVGEDLGEAVVGDVLVDREVDGERPHTRPITGRCGGFGGSCGLCLAAARTTQLHQLVLGDMGPGPRHLEDLAGSTETTSASVSSASQARQPWGDG